MRRQIHLTLLLIVLSPTLSAGAGDPLHTSRVPDLIESQVPATPAWVAADVAFGADGTLRSDLFAEATRRSVQRYLTNKEARRQAATTAEDRDECAIRLGRMVAQAAPTATADDLIRYSRAIFSGTVTAIREGFLFGSPGTLVAIDVETWLKNDATERRSVFLFHPSARIRTPNGTICSAPVIDAPSPSAGDRLMVFAYLQPVGEGVAVYRVEAAKQMVLHGRNMKHTPEAIREHARDSWKEMVDFVRKHPATKAVNDAEVQ